MESSLHTSGTAALNQFLAVYGPALTLLFIVLAIAVWVLWKSWKSERDGRQSDAKAHAGELKDMNTQLNAALRQGIDREIANEKRTDKLVSVLESTLERLERLGS